MKTTLSRLTSLIVLLCLSASVALNPAQQSQAAPGSIEAAPQGAWGIELVGQIGKNVSSVAVQGSYAYIVEGSGLTILDISNPGSPTTVGRTSPMPGFLEDVTVSGDYAYVADGDDGLRVVDVSDPANPVEVGFWDDDWWVFTVAVSGNYAYVSASGLRVVDVSNPANPVEVGSYFFVGSVREVAVLGSYAYLAVDTGFYVMDIADPANPSLTGFYQTPSYASGVAVSGNYAYVADGTLRVVDVSDPANPVEVGFYEAYVAAVAVSGSYVYVAGEGLRIVDVSNPANPVEVGFYDTQGYPSEVAVSGNYAYVADWNGVWVLDVSNPAAPVKVGSYGPLRYVVDMAVSGSYAYVADNRSGLWVVDVLNPAKPVAVGFYETPGFAQGVAVSGNYAYVADWNGLWVLDVSNPANPVAVGVYETPSPAQGVAVSGNYAYVAADYEGLLVVDVSDPANPVGTGFCNTLGYAISVAVLGNYAYVVDQYNGMRVVDVSDPANPIEVGFYATPGEAGDVAVSEGYAFVAEGHSLWVVNVSDPANPVETGVYVTPDEFDRDQVYGVAVSGNYAYMTTEFGLRVADVSNPASPVELSFYAIPSGYLSGDVKVGAAVSGDYAYKANGMGGMFILRFTPPLEYVGFHPDRDGYSFGNYGAKEYGDYTFIDMQHMFGESAVYWMTGAGHEIKSQASLWNIQNYQMMNSGHSYGMASSSLRFFKNMDTHPDTVSVYTLDKVDEIQFSWNSESYTTTARRGIGFFTVSQFVEPLRSAIHQSLDLTPAEVFTQIQSSMTGGAPDPLALLMINQDTGHALVPYAITSPSSSVYEVWVYDSEHPGDDERVMNFDLLADTWSYDTGNGVWSGDAASHSLGVIPTSAHNQLLECPWCTSSHLLTLEGAGHLLVTDSQGRRLGYTASEYVEEIPGAYGLAPILGTDAVHEPVFTLPLTETYTTLLDGQTVSQTAPASLWQFGAGYAVAVRGLNIGPNTQDELSIGNDGTLFSYHASQAQEPAVTLALDVLSATYGLDVQWLDIGVGETVTLTVDTTEGKLTLDGSQASGGIYNLLIRKASEAGGFPFYHSDIEILATDTHILHFGAWDGVGTITLEIDHNSDGTIDETLMLVNQVVWAYLPNLSK